MRIETLERVKTSIRESPEKIWTGLKLSTIALGPLTYEFLREIAHTSENVAALCGIVAAVVISVPAVLDVTVEDMRKSELLLSELPPDQQGLSFNELADRLHQKLADLRRDFPEAYSTVESAVTT